MVYNMLYNRVVAYYNNVGNNAWFICNNHKTHKAYCTVCDKPVFDAVLLCTDVCEQCGKQIQKYSICLYNVGKQKAQYSQSRHH